MRGQPTEEKRSNIPAPASRAVKTAVLRTGSEVPEVQRRNDSWGGADRAPRKVRKQERGKGKERKGKERKGKERKGVIAAKNSYEENGSGHGRGDPVDDAARGRRSLKGAAGCADSLPAGSAVPGTEEDTESARAAGPEESATPPRTATSRRDLRCRGLRRMRSLQGMRGQQSGLRHKQEQQEQKEQKDPEGLHRKQAAASRRKAERQQSMPRQKDLQRQAPQRDQWAGGREPGGSSGDPAKSARAAAAEAVFVVIPAGANGAAGSAVQAGTAGTAGAEGPGRAPPKAGSNRPAEATV